MTITFKVLTGPNTGKQGAGVTGADGKVSFTYHDDGGAGTDTLLLIPFDKAFSEQTGEAFIRGLARDLGHVQRAPAIYWLLQVAGRRCRKGVARLLHKVTRGVPRLINIVAHKALLLAYGAGSLRVEAAHIRAAAADTPYASRLGRASGFLALVRQWRFGASS